jgi:hypothetical protein
MARRHVIDLALDLAPMPALAPDFDLTGNPQILSVMRIAAASRGVSAAVAQTGEPVRL